MDDYLQKVLQEEGMLIAEARSTISDVLLEGWHGVLVTEAGAGHLADAILKSLAEKKILISRPDQIKGDE